MERNTKQFLIPEKKDTIVNEAYDLYPSHHIAQGKIESGYESLANELISKKKIIILDGYVGVDWDEVQHSLAKQFNKNKKSYQFIDIKKCLKSEMEIEKIITPFLGGDDPIFGFRTTLSLQDYFDPEKINAIDLKSNVDLHIIYGTGASQSTINGFLVYFDLPKSEIQYRMRSGGIANLGFANPKDVKQMYKQFFFIDWIILNKEKKKLLPAISLIVDQQRPNNPTWMTAKTLRAALSNMAQTSFRVRPWFEPGIWGGNWIKDRVDDLNKDVPNYAWSFEMIVPENGLLFEHNGRLLEVSFDMLLFQEGKKVLGKASTRFKDEFPIRFNFLDTFDGGNLSVQCHPSTEYIKKEFGENFTQDETYYILDTTNEAEVYLGFQQGIDPLEFKQQLALCYETKEILEVDKYIQKFKAKKHDLFLIPNGTVHSSGINNMVLEISATAYLFTFKMYDWQRLDLEGNPRPLNIDRAFDNLNFDRQGDVVTQTLISKEHITSFGKDWQVIHLPTHKDHFYAIYRYEFEKEIEIETLDQCHVLMLVEGTAIELQIQDSASKIFNYVETFVVPAATSKYKLINKGGSIAKVIVSFVKEEACL